MKNKTILITGASGFIATNFALKYENKYNFIKLSHLKSSNNITFAELESKPHIRARIDVILNLAGANIGSKRWSENRKRELLDSRIGPTHKIIELFNDSKYRPHLISASAVGIYDFNSINDENTVIDYKKYGSFSQQLTKQWEAEALKYNDKITITRFGVVLSSRGGALSKILPPFKLGFGGRLGDGSQGFPWIALEDLLVALELIIDNSYTGIFNLTSPKHITNMQLTKAIGKVWHRPTCMNLPRGIIKILYGQMGEELLLNGNRVTPRRLINLKFNYKYSEIDDCLKAIKEKTI